MKPLPLDIVREIVFYATYSIGPLRLVCQEWRDVVDDHYSKRKKARHQPTLVAVCSSLQLYRQINNCIIS
ncbi:hypothetical protein PRIPAC_76013 [Pristionchus pacificus]|uniref:F-box domain-containing protein n=1 Tax=Pristionchus pacificus TaxID=54126 RepID=A0A2A6C8B2_PRIPA|nr:hypothetical protein PRIPAC_76013 [Pristionchus pacificus]|eukprot:PDM74347.1 F-box domain-containing protein [Pristionchus pacificus]